MTTKSLGHCYLCGELIGKTAMKTHLLKKHLVQEGAEKCFLLKIEGASAKAYWLYVDIPAKATLKTLDDFLRKIWLECCGHMSAFSGAGQQKFGKTRTIDIFSPGDKILHEYDFGTTTETLITVVAETTRKTQKIAVRLLARNAPLVLACDACGKVATQICGVCMYETDNPYYCEDCADNHAEEEHDFECMLPITNSPRCGSCGYDGEQDTFIFQEKK